MSTEWEKDDHGHWTLIFKEEKVRFLTPKQKEDLQKIFDSVLDTSVNKNLDE